MTPSSNCFDLIKSEEGCILHPYYDKAGVPTIGWGTTRYPNGVRVKMTDPPRTQPEVDAYLVHDVGVVSFELNEFDLPPLTQNQYDARVLYHLPAIGVSPGDPHAKYLSTLALSHVKFPL